MILFKISIDRHPEKLALNSHSQLTRKDTCCQVLERVIAIRLATTLALGICQRKFQDLTIQFEYGLRFKFSLLKTQNLHVILVLFEQTGRTDKHLGKLYERKLENDNLINQARENQVNFSFFTNYFSQTFFKCFKLDIFNLNYNQFFK